MTTVPDLCAALAAQRVLPVLREPDPAAAVARVAVLVAAGARVIELTTSTADWPTALAESVRQTDGRVIIGMGTITTADQARTAIDRGATFLVSPFPCPPVRAVVADTPFVEGGFTPAEIAASSSFGLAKVFPAHVGGPAFIRSLLAVLPAALLVPTGGIALGDVAGYLAAGALAVGVGSGLPDDPVELAGVFGR